MKVSLKRRPLLATQLLLFICGNGYLKELSGVRLHVLLWALCLPRAAVFVVNSVAWLYTKACDTRSAPVFYLSNLCIYFDAAINTYAKETIGMCNTVLSAVSLNVLRTGDRDILKRGAAHA